MTERGASLICLLIAFSIFLGLSILSGCETAPPKMDVSFWAGDSENAAITRSQGAGSSLKCADPKFDDYMCISSADFLIMMDKVASCKEW